MLKRIVAVLVVVGALVAGLVHSQRPMLLQKVSGFVESDEIRIGSRIGGRVAKVYVAEGDIVRQGQTLVELEAYQLHEQLAQARAVLREAEAERDRLVAGFRPEELAQARAREAQWTAARDQLGGRAEDIAAARASVELATAQRELAGLELDRVRKLFEKKVVAQSELDRAETEHRVATATVHVRNEELSKLERVRPLELLEAEAHLEEAHQEVLLRQRGYRDEDKARAIAHVDAAQAAHAAIEQQLAELVIRAPTDGAVEAIDLRPGDLVGAGAPAISIVEVGRLWIRAYVPEAHLDLAVGRAVWVTVDSLPGKRFSGHISYVSRQAEFTPSNIQTLEDRSRQVFRIKVLIDDGGEVLRPGMSGDVWIVEPPRQP